MTRSAPRLQPGPLVPVLQPKGMDLCGDPKSQHQFHSTPHLLRFN
jgi:hypothetical protein